MNLDNFNTEYLKELSNLIELRVNAIQKELKHLQTLADKIKNHANRLEKPKSYNYEK